MAFPPTLLTASLYLILNTVAHLTKRKHNAARAT